MSPLTGAKAGALNYCLQNSALDADLIVAIDADYQAEPDFLQHTVGFFSDPNIGYVQTPHDYRKYDASPYQRACYWEYLPFQKVHLPSLNDYGAPIITGTMCTVRKRALVEAGGWADWCLTEDAELSVRVRARLRRCLPAAHLRPWTDPGNLRELQAPTFPVVGRPGATASPPLEAVPPDPLPCQACASGR